MKILEDIITNKLLDSKQGEIVSRTSRFVTVGGYTYRCNNEQCKKRTANHKKLGLYVLFDVI